MALKHYFSYLILILTVVAYGGQACPESCERCDPEFGCIKYKEAPVSDEIIRRLSGVSCPDLCASCDSGGICQVCKLNAVVAAGSCYAHLGTSRRECCAALAALAALYAKLAIKWLAVLNASLTQAPTSATAPVSQATTKTLENVFHAAILSVMSAYLLPAISASLIPATLLNALATQATMNSMRNVFLAMRNSVLSATLAVSALDVKE